MTNSVNYKFSINQTIYTITAQGIQVGTVLGVYILFTPASSSPLITYSVRLAGALSSTQIAEAEIYQYLEDTGSPPVEGAITAYAAMIA